MCWGTGMNSFLSGRHHTDCWQSTKTTYAPLQRVRELPKEQFDQEVDHHCRYLVTLKWSKAWAEANGQAWGPAQEAEIKEKFYPATLNAFSTKAAQAKSTISQAGKNFLASVRSPATMQQLRNSVRLPAFNPAVFSNSFRSAKPGFIRVGV